MITHFVLVEGSEPAQGNMFSISVLQTAVRSGLGADQVLLKKSFRTDPCQDRHPYKTTLLGLGWG